MQCNQTVNVDRLKPFHARADDPLALIQVSNPVQEGKHEVELLLNSKEISWVLHYLVQWLLRTTSGCWRRSLLTALSGWQSTALPPCAAGAPAGPQ
jgi:hypothetical protein